MPEPEAPQAPQEAPKSPLNPSLPLSQQTNTLLKLMGDDPNKEPEKKEETPKEPEKENPEDKPKDPETPKEEVFLPEDYDDDEIERPIPVLEAKTWQEYVSKNIQPIQVSGTIGEERKVLSVYTEDQLPADFQFASDVDRLRYGRAFDRLERQAERLQQDFLQREQQIKLHEFEVQEAKDVASDLKWLQSRGVAPKFQYEDDDSRFNSDPAVKEVNEIYDLYKRVNNEYAQKFMGTNRTYRISFRDAADKYYASKVRQASRAEKPADKPPEKTSTQKERDKIAGKVSAPQGGDAGTAKPKAFAGMSFNDINRLVKANKI